MESNLNSQRTGEDIDMMGLEPIMIENRRMEAQPEATHSSQNKGKSRAWSDENMPDNDFIHSSHAPSAFYRDVGPSNIGQQIRGLSLNTIGGAPSFGGSIINGHSNHSVFAQHLGGSIDYRPTINYNFQQPGYNNDANGYQTHGAQGVSLDHQNHGTTSMNHDRSGLEDVSMDLDDFDLPSPSPKPRNPRQSNGGHLQHAGMGHIPFHGFTEPANHHNEDISNENDGPISKRLRTRHNQPSANGPGVMPMPVHGGNAVPALSGYQAAGPQHMAQINPASSHGGVNNASQPNVYAVQAAASSSMVPPSGSNVGGNNNAAASPNATDGQNLFDYRNRPPVPQLDVLAYINTTPHPNENIPGYVQQLLNAPATDIVSSNWTAALAANAEKATWTCPQPDSTIPSSNGTRLTWLQILRRAFYDLTYKEEKGNGLDGEYHRTWEIPEQEGNAPFPSADVDYVLWQMLILAERMHREGAHIIPTLEMSKSFLGDMDKTRGWNFAMRMQKLFATLLGCKTRAAHLLKDSAKKPEQKLYARSMMVAVPAFILQRKQRNYWSGPQKKASQEKKKAEEAARAAAAAGQLPAPAQVPVLQDPVVQPPVPQVPFLQVAPVRNPAVSAPAIQTPAIQIPTAQFPAAQASAPQVRAAPVPRPEIPVALVAALPTYGVPLQNPFMGNGIQAGVPDHAVPPPNRFVGNGFQAGPSNHGNNVGPALLSPVLPDWYKETINDASLTDESEAHNYFDPSNGLHAKAFPEHHGYTEAMLKNGLHTDAMDTDEQPDNDAPVQVSGQIPVELIDPRLRSPEMIQVDGMVLHRVHYKSSEEEEQDKKVLDLMGVAFGNSGRPNDGYNGQPMH